ncbi:MAG: nitroreductase family protein [Oligoflexia bacterium]|nr:nitroreductase family protein [Oligoflexia bacterium]
MEQSDTLPENAAAIFEQIVTSRRSVRIFDGSPVPESVIEKSLDMALSAPNSSNLQPWEFHWVKTPELKVELVKACLSQAAAATASEFIVCLARTATWERARVDVLNQLEKHEKAGVRIPRAAFEYYRKLVPLMYAQGPFGLRGLLKRILFFWTGLSKPTPREPVSRHDMEVWATKSTALACENFMLAIRAYGYDTCPMEGFDSVRVRRLLDIPSDALIPMIISVGKRGPKGVTLPVIRADRSLFVKIR